jgi:hypothetical protein
MAEGTVTTLQLITGEDITASCTLGTTVYLGTNKGRIYKHTISGGALTATPIANLNAAILSMSMYSTVLYVGVEGGRLYSVTTA